MKFWPFKLTPKGMLLEGKDLEKAKARYNLEGEELERTLLELEYDDKEDVDYKKAILEIDKAHDKIEPLEYEKQKATLNNEPWVAYRDYGLEEQDGRTGFWFDFDWNNIFIQKLRDEGYEAVDDEALIKKWYAELCRVVALDEGLAMDMFEDDENVEEVGSGIRKRKNSDGTIDYS